jgi:hypothetical protein
MGSGSTLHYMRAFMQAMAGPGKPEAPYDASYVQAAHVSWGRAHGLTRGWGAWVHEGGWTL